MEPDPSGPTVTDLAAEKRKLPVQKQLSSSSHRLESLFYRFRPAWGCKLRKASRLRDAQISFITAMSLSLDKVVLLAESLPVRDTPSLKPPYEAMCGVMMSRDESERTSF